MCVCVWLRACDTHQHTPADTEARFDTKSPTCNRAKAEQTKPKYRHNLGSLACYQTSKSCYAINIRQYLTIKYYTALITNTRLYLWPSK